MNVIPAIDLRQGQCVRLYQGDFDQQTDYGNEPASLAQEYESIGFNALHIVDLDGAQTGQQVNKSIIREIVEKSKLAVQLGGGIRNKAHIESWLATGLTRVVIGSVAVQQPNQVRDWLRIYGSERIVLALDVNIDTTGIPHLATHGWTQTEDKSLWQCIDEYAGSELKYVLCTDISRDGALSGPNLALYAELRDRYPRLYLQASGGVRHLDDLKALREIGVQAAISGRALLDGKITRQEVSTFLPAA